MDAIILKYFKYAEFEFNHKFNYAVAFTRTNAVLETLKNISSVKTVSIVVPDEEYDNATKYIHSDKESILTFSQLAESGQMKSMDQLLFIDEQAFYVPEDIFAKAIALSNDHEYVGWADNEALLYSFNYAASFYFFVSPAHHVQKLLKTHASFYSLFQQITNDTKCHNYNITVEDIPAVYGKCVKYNPMPYHFAIEPTSYCDSKCIMCPFHSPDPEIAKGSVYLGDGGENMPLGKFKQLVDEIDQLPWHYLPLYRHPQITVQLRGEPLLAPNFKEMCSHVKSKNIRLSFSTNGNNLNKDDMINFLLDIGLDEIVVSIDPDEESFKRIRPQLSYDNVVNNIRTLYQERMDRKIDRPKIYTKTVVLQNSAELNFEEIAKRFLDCSDMVGFAFENFEDFKSGSKGFSNYFLDISNLKRVPCLLASDVVAIHADGNVKLCYGDVKATVGNVNNNSIEHILLNSKLRRDVLTGNSKGNYDITSECKACTSWLAQYNIVKDEGCFNIYQNPILSYWQKKASVAPSVELKKSIFKKAFERFNLQIGRIYRVR